MYIYQIVVLIRKVSFQVFIAYSRTKIFNRKKKLNLNSEISSLNISIFS